MGGSQVISAFMITYQCIILDFTLEGTIRSCLDFCDYLYINDGKSTDGTRDILYSLQREYGSDRLRIFERDWLHDRSFWTAERNFLVDMIPDDFYILHVDADEVFHENDMHLIRESVEKFLVINTPMIHFYGRPTNYITGPVWAPLHTKLFRKSTGIKLINIPGGCADDIVWPDGRCAHFSGYNSCEAVIYHYGNCRNPKALGIKAKKADDLYKNSQQYLDGSLPEPRSFSYAESDESLDAMTQRFTGSHPKYVKKWVEQHEDQPLIFKALETDVPNKLWCFK
jgi:hypothetical protein